MRGIVVVLGAVFIALPGLASAQPAANLLRNGDFSEQGSDAPTGWKMGKDAQPWKLEPAGDAAKKPVLTVTIARGQANQGVLEQTVKSVAPNTRCVAEAQVKASRKGIALLMIKLFDAAGHEIKRVSSPLNAGTDWETLRVDSIPAAAAVSVLCRYHTRRGPGRCGGFRLPT